MTSSDTPRRRLLMVMPYQQLARKATDAGFDVWSIWDPTMQTAEYLDQVAENSRELLLADFTDTRALGDLIAGTAAEHRIELVLCLGNEDIQLPVVTRARELGLSPNHPDSIRRINDKSEMRALLNGGGLSPVAAVTVGDVGDVGEAALGLGLPVIVKPAALSGSRGVALLRDPADIDRWRHRVTTGGHGGPYVVEEYLQGPEFSVETLTVEGKHHVIGITAKRTTGAPGFIETGHVFPAPLPEVDAEALTTLVTSLLDLADYRFGPAHTEVVLTSSGPRIIESQTRIGGDRIPALIRLAADFDIEAEVFRTLAGTEVPEVRATRSATVGFFGFPPGVIAEVSPELEKVRGFPFVDTLHFPFAAGDRMPVTEDSFTRHGFVILTADSPEQAAERVETVRSLIVPALVPGPAADAVTDRTVLLIGGVDAHLEAYTRFGARVVLLQHPDKLTPYQTEAAHVLLVVDYTDWETLLPFAEAARRVYSWDIVTSLTEGGLSPAARLADLFGQGDGRRHEVSVRMRNKMLMRQHLAAKGSAPSIAFSTITDRASLEDFGRRAGYPFIIKPTDTTAGFGVTRVTSEEDLDRAWRHVEKLLGTRTDRGSTLFRVTEFMAEEYIDGPEFSVEAFGFDGRHHVLAITEKLVGSGHFAELGHAVPARLSTVDHARIVAAVEEHLGVMGVLDGPSHTEIRLSDRGPVVIESHNRMGGDFIIELVAAAYGIDLPAWSAAHSLGLMDMPDHPPGPLAGACVRFLTGTHGVVTAVHGADRIAARPEVITSSVSARPGRRTRPPADNWDRLGHVAVRAFDTTAAVELCERLIREEIRIEVR
ncbi:ATP-grasp domain-containing protein [Streptomyces sp. ST2-7A]|uniref:ATP-grasp domain-containing protein n=1 Tax=Streptomyces sp. ST2-7A TaxID=2907214 RepID=UPI001F1B6664|nr:ATP-grasp domain-containing protein [Streptomyces sp. ST2-7A]MCE7079528.1 ATP-grasp domain-containing protein [Streptomyces sp. ST2-7A]